MSSSETATLDQAALDTLTPEERAAIADEPSADEVAALKAIAAGADDDDDDEDAPAEVAAEPAAATIASEVPGDAAVPEPAAQADVEPTPRLAQGRYTAVLPDGFDASVAALASERQTAVEAFKAGDITIDELQAKQADLDGRRDELTVARVKAEISKEMRDQLDAQSWQNTIDSFFDTTAKNEQVDYRKDTARAADFDLFVRALGNNEANSDKSMTWFLTEAHRRVNALHGRATPVAVAAVDAQKAIADAKAARKPAAGAIPTTLAHAPGGPGPGDVGGEFATLDALDGDDLEAAIAKMTPAQRAKYAKGD